MDRYTINGIVPGNFAHLEKDAQEHQWELLKAADSVLYRQFEIARAAGTAVFQMTLNDVVLKCKYSIADGCLRYDVTRPDNGTAEFYRFRVDLDDIDDSILSDDITETRLVSLWLVAGHRF